MKANMVTLEMTMIFPVLFKVVVSPVAKKRRWQRVQGPEHINQPRSVDCAEPDKHPKENPAFPATTVASERLDIVGEQPRPVTG